MASATALLSFMSAYAIFMAPIAGILTADYWLVKKRKYDVPALYDPSGMYSFGKFGVNWRALATTLVIVIPLLPGLGNKVTPDNVQLNEGLRNLFSFNWLYGYCASIFMYYVLNLFFPDRSTLIERVVPGNDYSSIDGHDADTESRTTDDGYGKVQEATMVKEVGGHNLV